MQKKQPRRVLTNELVSPAEKEKYASQWAFLKGKSDGEYAGASIYRMTVYQSYSKDLNAPIGEVGYVCRKITLLRPESLRENNKRASWEDLDEAARLASDAAGDPALFVIFRDDGLFVLARKKSAD